MSEEELITKQQLEIEAYKAKAIRDAETIKEITIRFIGMGQPMNDNMLKFNKEQLHWCAGILKLLERL